MKLTVINTGFIDTWLHLHSRPLTAEKNIRIEVPVPCYLIEHAGKKILFDAGQKPLQKNQDPLADYYIKVTEKETALKRLEAMDISADDIDLIIISHAHGDHYAGLADFPCAQVVAQRDAAAALQRFSNRFRIIDGDCDLFNDGRIICLSTPGHAPGHQSLLLTMDDQTQKLLSGDVVYLPAALDYRPGPEEYAERPDYFDSIKKVRMLQDKGVEVIFGHDPYHLLQ